MRRKISCAILWSVTMLSSLLIGTTAMANEEKITIRYDSQDEAWKELAIINDEKVHSSVNIRSSSDRDGEIIGFMEPGSAAWVIKKGKKWTELYSGGVTGFVKNKYLRFGKKAKAAVKKYAVEGVTADWDGINMYSAPDGASDVIDWMNTGDDYVVVEDNGHWLTVQYSEDTLAYVSEDDVQRAMLLDAAIPNWEEEETEEYAEEDYSDEYEDYSDDYSYTDNSGYTDNGYGYTEPQYTAPQTEYVPPQTEAPQTEYVPPQTEAPQTEAPQTEAPQTEAPAETEAPSDPDDGYVDGDNGGDTSAGGEGWYDADTDTYYDGNGNVISG